MNSTKLLFHIDRRGGLEFVFNSGEALSYPMHAHVSAYTVTAVKSGTVRLLRPNRTDFYEAGNTYVVAPHEPHSPAYMGAFDIVSLCIKTALLSTMDHAALTGRCLKYARLLMERGLLSASAAEGLLRGLLAIYGQDAAYGQAAAGPPEILETWPPLKAGPAGAEALPPLSRFHFIRKFKHETGLTPHQYLIQNRVRQAKKFLNETSIAEAAILAGFCDQSHLNRCFKRSLGITPRLYRRSCFFWEA